MTAKKDHNRRCRPVSVSMTPEDEESLLREYPGTFSDAIRSAIADARAYRRLVHAQGMQQESRDV